MTDSRSTAAANAHRGAPFIARRALGGPDDAMTPRDENVDLPQYSSPACSMNEVDPAYMGLEAALEQRSIAVWRKRERERLIEARRKFL